MTNIHQYAIKNVGITKHVFTVNIFFISFGSFLAVFRSKIILWRLTKLCTE